MTSPHSGVEIAVTHARQQQLGGALLIDIRQPEEQANGIPEGANCIPQAQLTHRIQQISPDPQRPLLLLCGHGIRSLDSTYQLRQLGYANTHSVTGGMAAWRQQQLPITLPSGEAGTLNADAADRYSRQINLTKIGLQGQQKLAASKVAMIGAGGLGAPAAQYLAGAGVGQLTLVDDDRVERSNLHRQVIHTDERVGMLKVESARIALTALNPTINVQPQATRITDDNVIELLRGHDLIFDGADNFATRYLLSRASLQLGIPLIFGAVEQFNGQVSLFDPRRPDSPCYRCLFPSPPDKDTAPNCSEAGVLGVMPGLVGMIQACETLKHLLGIGDPLVGRLLLIDALGMQFHTLKLPRQPDCPGCGHLHTAP